MDQRIVSRVYDAAAGQDEWSDVVGSIGDHINADVFFLGAGDPRDPSKLEHWGTGWNWKLFKKFGFEVRDIWDPTVNPAICAGMIVPVERAFDHRKIIPEDTLRTSEFIQKNYYETGYDQHLIFTPMRDGHLLSGGLVGKKNGRAFNKLECERLDMLLPHLGRAMRLRHQIARHKNVERGLSDLLDRLDKAVFLLDRNMKVLFLNGRADNLVRCATGISIQRGRLSLAQATPDLRKAMVEIEADRLRPGRPPAFPIIGSAEAGTLIARVYPGTGFADIPRASRVFASVIVETQLDVGLPEPEELRTTFGLTPAEAAVASQIPSGASRRGIAKALGLQENTVKTHLASIRAKTGAGNMVELALILQMSTGRR